MKCASVNGEIEMRKKKKSVLKKIMTRLIGEAVLGGILYCFIYTVT